MSYIKLWERFWVTDMSSRGCYSGAITVDSDKCNGCGMCTKVCPGDALNQGEDKQPVFKVGAEIGCVACGACMAICPMEAIAITKEVNFTGRFRRPRRGALAAPRLFKELRPSE